MVRPRKHDLDSQKDKLIIWFQKGATYQDIVRRLQDEGQSIEVSTIKRAFRSWSVRKRQAAIDLDIAPALAAQIKFYFWIVGLSDQEMLKVLQKEGYELKPKALAKLRLGLNLYRRTNDPDLRQRQDDAALAALIEELRGDTPIDQDGKAYLSNFVRDRQLIISRYSTFLPA